MYSASVTEMFPGEMNSHVNQKNWTCTVRKFGQFNLEQPVK